MRKSKLYPLMVLMANFGLALAQQDVTFTLYNYNMNVINPAYAGSDQKAEFTSNYRAQWAGLEGAPQTLNFSLSSPIPNVEKAGFALSVTNSSVFVLQETDIFADFSYRLQLAQTTDLFLGLKAGGSSVNIDLAGIGSESDPLFTENVSVFNPNVG
ncbi:MAG: PorP/SprF family type IX secretion system membrane protein, partial [Bacteroidota bacterium]